MGPLGPHGLGPDGLPWAPLGLMGPMGQALMAPLGPNWP